MFSKGGSVDVFSGEVNRILRGGQWMFSKQRSIEISEGAMDVFSKGVSGCYFFRGGQWIFS